VKSQPCSPHHLGRRVRRHWVGFHIKTRNAGGMRSVTVAKSGLAVFSKACIPRALPEIVRDIITMQNKLRTISYIHVAPSTSRPRFDDFLVYPALLSPSCPCGESPRQNQDRWENEKKNWNNKQRRIFRYYGIGGQQQNNKAQWADNNKPHDHSGRRQCRPDFLEDSS